MFSYTTLLSPVQWHQCKICENKTCMNIWSYLEHMDALACKASQPSSWCQNSLEKVGEDHLSIQCVPVAIHYLLFYVLRVEPQFWLPTSLTWESRDLLLSLGPDQVRCPAPVWVAGAFGQGHSELALVHCSISATATPSIVLGVMEVVRPVQPSREARPQVLISLRSGICKN